MHKKWLLSNNGWGFQWMWFIHVVMHSKAIASKPRHLRVICLCVVFFYFLVPVKENYICCITPFISANRTQRNSIKDIANVHSHCRYQLETMYIQEIEQNGLCENMYHLYDDMKNYCLICLLGLQCIWTTAKVQCLYNASIKGNYGF